MNSKLSHLHSVYLSLDCIAEAGLSSCLFLPYLTLSHHVKISWQIASYAWQTLQASNCFVMAPSAVVRFLCLAPKQARSSFVSLTLALWLGSNVFTLKHRAPFPILSHYVKGQFTGPLRARPHCKYFFSFINRISMDSEKKK